MSVNMSPLQVARPARLKNIKRLVRCAIALLLVIAVVEALALHGYNSTLEAIQNRLKREAVTSTKISDLKPLHRGWFVRTSAGEGWLTLQWPSLFKTYVVTFEIDEDGEVLGFSTDAQQPAGPTEKEPVVVLPDPEGTLTLRNSPAGSHVLVREIFRQAIFMTARDEFGLLTRDPVLQEQDMSTDAGENWPLTVDVQVRDAEQVEVILQLKQQKPTKQQLLFDRKLAVPRGQLITVLAEQSAAWMQRDLIAALSAAGFRKQPKPSLEPMAGETLLTAEALDPVSQFAVVRAAQARLTSGENTAELRTLLARSYALLGSLTETHWNLAHKVFKARALLLAEQTVRDFPETREVYWTRAYVRGLCGLHQFAVDDIERAREHAEMPPPGWVEPLEAYCRWDLPRLQGPFEQAPNFARYLQLLAAEIAGTPAQHTAAARQLWESNPHCYRAAVSLMYSLPIAERADIGYEQLARFHRDLPELLYGVSRLPDELPQLVQARRIMPAEPNLPQQQVLRQVLNDQSPPDALTWRRQVVDKLVAAGDRTVDHGEPSWQVLGRLIDDLAFTQSVSVLTLSQAGYWRAANSVESEWQPAFASHPLVLVVEALDYDQVRARQALENFRPILTGLEFSDSAWMLKQVLSPLGQDQILREAIQRQHDFTVTDLTMSDRRYRTPNDFTLIRPKQTPSELSERDLQILRELAPQCPLVAATVVLVDWEQIQPHAREWEVQYSASPRVIGNLARKFEESKRLEDAERCLRRLVELNPEPESYRRLADVLEQRDQREEWANTIRQLIAMPQLDSDSEPYARRAAIWFMDREDYAAARPFAEFAVDSLHGGAERLANCYEGMGLWREAESIWRSRARSYEVYVGNWYFWCKRTGRGDSVAALAVARRDLSQRQNTLEAELDLRKALIHWLEGEWPEAFEECSALARRKGGHYYRMLTAIVAHKQNQTADRDRMLNLISNDERNTCLPYLARSVRRFLQSKSAVVARDELEFYWGLDLGDGDSTDHCYFIAQALQMMGADEASIPWLQQCASSPRSNKFTAALAGAELQTRGLETPVRRGSESPREFQSAVKHLLAGYKLAAENRHADALKEYEAAREAAPDWMLPDYCCGLAFQSLAYMGMVESTPGHIRELWRTDVLQFADREWTALIERTPNIPEFYLLRGKSRVNQRRYHEAIDDFTAGLQMDPDCKPLHHQLGFLYATCADDTIRDGRKAVEHAERSLGRDPSLRWLEVNVLAAAYAEVGDFQQAVKYQKLSINTAPETHRSAVKYRLQLYQEHQPYRRHASEDTTTK